jgi:uncharacterized protein (DUF885 family)/phosphatidylserine/phosphatidylglycerophosphate/cardiolipin synthase-like enzyme
MPRITSATAWANNEVAYIAWDTDAKLVGCLGFEVTRIYLDADGNVAKRRDGSDDRVKCAAWVAFKGQRNRDWIPQDTGVWPVQKFSWRDLTLRQRRDRLQRRPSEVSVRYEIRAVGPMRTGLEPVPSNGREVATITKRDKAGNPMLDANGKPIKERGKAYSGKPRSLGYLTPPMATNAITVTATRPPFRTTFTNGILAAQWLKNVLMADGVQKPNELLDKLANPADPHRKYLAGDTLPLVHELFSRPGSFELALYELDDAELEALLIANKQRVRVILSNTGVNSAGEWDARNAPARKRLRAALGARLQDRLFNNSTHIGHNKFVVHLDEAGTAQAVFTGSTNWTSTGFAGQTNNALLIEDANVAAAYHDCWNRLLADKLPAPRPKRSSAMTDSQQSAAFRVSNAQASVVTLASGVEIQTWFSPNMLQRRKPSSATRPAPVPPDLQEVYRRMRHARDAVLFLAFYPGQRGVDCVIGEAIAAGQRDSKLLVAGAVSSPQAMPNYVPKSSGADEDDDSGDGVSPATFDTRNVSIVRASRIDEATLLGDLGVEQLTARGGIGAIIHDKIVVIDPLSADCCVILGSHNLGYKASYSNDENMVIITGHRELALAYAVHVMDVYDHYRFRAIEQDLARQGKKGWSGFLDTNDRWQDSYVAHRKGALSRYFARGAAAVRSLALIAATAMTLASSVAAQASSPSQQLAATLAAVDSFNAGRAESALEQGQALRNLPDLSQGRWLRDAAFWQHITRRVAAIPDRDLLGEELLTLRTLRWQARLSAERAPHWWVDFSDITPYASPIGPVARAIAAMPIRTATDTGAVLSLLRGIPAMIDTIRAGIVARERRGILLASDAIPASVGLLRTYAARGTENPFAINAARLSSLDDATRNAVIASSARVVDSAIAPAVERLVATLSGPYATRAPSNVGLAQYPGGPAFYRWLVRWHTTIETTPAAVHAVGLAQVARIEREMAEVRKQVGFTGTSAEFRAALAKDPRFFATTPDEFGQRLMSYAKRLEPQLDSFFGVRPRARGDVRRLPPALEPAMTFGYYQTPTDNDSVGHYLYNGTKLNERSLLTAGPLIAHELWPGHHFQVSIARESTTLPSYLRNSYFTAYGEGWGDYAAIVAGEMGLYADPYDRYGRLAMDMFISCRLVVDTGMHALGWSRDRARQYMREHVTESEAQIQSESLRYATDLPGQALAYKMGSLEFERLRAHAQQALGTRFSIRSFHDQVLSSGSVPLSVVEAKLRDWLMTSR